MKPAKADDLVIDYNARNHPIRVVKVNRTLTVRANGEEILRSRNAYMIDEYGHKPVYYFPIIDAREGTLKQSETVTVCPYKGRAHYYSLVAGGKEYSDAVWRYSEPTEEFVPIKDYIAFYDSAIEGIEES